MALLTHKIKGSSLLETLIAMVVVLVCFSIATMVLVNTMKSDNGRLKLHARLEMNALYIKALEDQDFVDNSTPYEGFTIDKKTEPYQDKPGLYLVSLKAISATGQALGELKHIILIDKHAE